MRVQIQYTCSPRMVIIWICGGFEKSRFEKKKVVAGLQLPRPFLFDLALPVCAVGLVVVSLLPPTTLKGILSTLYLENLPTRIVFVGGIVEMLCSVIVLLYTYEVMIAHACNIVFLQK